MAVTIRLSRIGKKHVPFFRIVAVDSRKKRDGAFIENLGTYDALKSKLVQFHEDRIADWIAKGAQVTDAVKKLQRLHKENAQKPAVTKKASSAKKEVAAAPKKEVEKVVTETQEAVETQEETQAKA